MNLSQPSVELREFERDYLYKIALKLKDFAIDKKRFKHDYFPDKTFIEVTLDYVRKRKNFIGCKGNKTHFNGH